MARSQESCVVVTVIDEGGFSVTAGQKRKIFRYVGNAAQRAGTMVLAGQYVDEHERMYRFGPDAKRAVSRRANRI
jgi:hypothetical protein